VLVGSILGIIYYLGPAFDYLGAAFVDQLLDQLLVTYNQLLDQLGLLRTSFDQLWAQLGLLRSSFGRSSIT
jgi:hypothetical protein